MRIGKPLYDRIVVRQLEAEEKTKGGIIIPDIAKEKPQIGEVVAAGEGRLLTSGTIIPLKVKVGDRVLYGKYSGNEFTTKDGEELIIIKEEDIFMIL